MSHPYQVHPDITVAETLPGSFYSDPEAFELLREKIFANGWHWVGDEGLVALSNTAYPFQLYDPLVSEPLLLIRDQNDQINCLSNVCTHRGNQLVNHQGKLRSLVCGYHGRKFQLDGRFVSMPEFEEAKNFPRPCDDLPNFPIERLGPFLFVGLKSSFDFTTVLNNMQERIGFLPLHEFRPTPHLNKDYVVNCHWALYCDNYLEGFHIPFVHSGLNNVLDYGHYITELYDHCNLQVGYASSGEDTFDLPMDHPDHGQHVAAYYYWVFPNMMFNFYPWGLSVNIVKPISMNKTRVSFISYVYDESKLSSGAGANIDKVEREDEAVVEGVHKGLKSRHYTRGRFSPTRERGVHQFQRLLSEQLEA